MTHSVRTSSIICLEALVVATDRAQPLTVLERAGDGRKDEQTELHVVLLTERSGVG